MIITIAHQKGGVGKSTIASNLAVEYFKEFGSALTIVDLDTQKSLSYFNAIRKANALPSLPIVQVASAEELKKIITANTGVILIDAGGFDSDVNRVAMLYADRIITPVSDSSFEIAGLMMFRGIIRELRVARPDLVATVVLNRVHPFATKSLNDIFDFARNNVEFDVFATVLRDRGEYKRATENGKSVVELVRDGKAAEEIKNLMREMNNEQV